MHARINDQKELSSRIAINETCSSKKNKTIRIFAESKKC